MPRKKIYEISQARAEQARKHPEELEELRHTSNAGRARIDMVALLGSDARFTTGQRNLDLSVWLGRGIDAWVWASVTCLTSMLRSGARQTASVTGYAYQLKGFFEFLTDAPYDSNAPRLAAPSDLSPIHVQGFIAWIQNRARTLDWRTESTRTALKAVKSVLLEMFAQGFIQGDPSRFFTRAPISSRGTESRQTSLSDGEQERLAQALKSDLVAIHHGRLSLNPGDVQALRLLLVAHRQGSNATPLLELRRDALSPGLLPGTVRIRTAKHRNKKLRSGIGRDVSDNALPGAAPEEDVIFSLAEGAVLQQAISSTQHLVDEAPSAIKNRVWLYRSQASGTRRGAVTCLRIDSLAVAIKGLQKRHQLLGDDGSPIRLNLSRLRKSFFDRAFRASDGDLVVTANLMGNTPQVASLNCPSMNDARKAEAAGFMNDYPELMRTGTQGRKEARTMPRVIDVQPFGSTPAAKSTSSPVQTPVSMCADTFNGEHAPQDGHQHCDRFVMCLFCSSFAIVGTVDDLWRLFSFQAFAREELMYLDEMLGPERTNDTTLEDLRDRYRLVVPYIDDFTLRQFSSTNVVQARAKAEASLHPFWRHQIAMSRRGQRRRAEADPKAGVSSHGNAIQGAIGA